MRSLTEFVNPDFTAESIAVDSQQARSARLVAARSVKHPHDEFFFKFIYCFVKMNTPLHHLSDQSFQLILHLSTLQID